MESWSTVLESFPPFVDFFKAVNAQLISSIVVDEQKLADGLITRPKSDKHDHLTAFN